MIEVQATKLGFYGNRRRRAGDVFTIADEEAFAKSWMTRLEAKKEESKDESSDMSTTQDSTVVEPNGGEKSPPGQGQQPNETGNIDSDEREKIDQQLSKRKLNQMNKDDLIGEALKLGLDKNIDLIELTNKQIVELILEAYEQLESVGDD
tara:strand:+ start:485 stop:934 length:450 start_codon:yes stop_codon:yes gene_type:complete